MGLRSAYSLNGLSADNCYIHIDSIHIHKIAGETVELDKYIANFCVEVCSPVKDCCVNRFNLAVEFDPDSVGNLYTLGYTNIKLLNEFSSATDE